MKTLSDLTSHAIHLLQQLIQTPSMSREEGDTADLIFHFLQSQGLAPQRLHHNIWVKSDAYDPNNPTILLNSHHDTVKPAKGWTLDPFLPEYQEDGRLTGLGSNDAGASLVSLIAAFIYLNQSPQKYPFNLILAASAEEEISGKNGIEALLPQLGKIDLGIVGEPTQMHMAIAEKGLMVLDCTVRGQSGHAARDEGENALYKAMPIIEWFRTHPFEKVSDFLGPVKTSVTQIAAGSQHNVVPDTCTFVVDVRTNECYSNQELFAYIDQQVACEVKARSFRLNSSRLAPSHPIVKAGQSMGLQPFGSPTLSDQALMPFPTLKIGPGDSARSHTADEYIFPKEIAEGIELYVKLLNNVKF